MIKHEIYYERLRLGKSNQASFQDHLNELDVVLEKNMGPDERHPFDSYPDVDFCATVSEYANGAHWVSAKCLDKVDYMFRIEKYSSLIKYNIVNEHSFFGNIGKDALSIKRDFDFIVNSFIKEKLWWTPISELLVSYAPHRNFSWWTNECLSNIVSSDHRLIKDNLTMIHSCGIANDWIKNMSIIMRCRLDDQLRSSCIRRPSAIDAFPQPIFNPSREEDPLETGKAILVSENLSVGFNEYVIKNLRIENIEFIPLRINESEIYINNPEACLDKVFFKLLEYHRTC